MPRPVCGPYTISTSTYEPQLGIHLHLRTRCVSALLSVAFHLSAFNLNVLYISSIPLSLRILFVRLCECVDGRELGDGHRCVRAGQRALAIERLGRPLLCFWCVLALARRGALGALAPSPIFRSRTSNRTSTSYSYSSTTSSLHHQRDELSEHQRQCQSAICGSTCGRGAVVGAGSGSGAGAGARAVAAVGSRAASAAAGAVALDGAAARERVPHQLPAREGHRHAQRRVATAQGPGALTCAHAWKRLYPYGIHLPNTHKRARIANALSPSLESTL